MSLSLETMKNLRSRGASVQMQEDLASFLPNGYDSPLFLPTIDFILLLQNRAQSQQQEQEQSVDLSQFNIPKVYDPNYFDKISLKATGEMIKGAKIADQLKQEILAYLDIMEIQQAKHLGLIGAGGQEIASEKSLQRQRAQISEAKRRDRGTGRVKSMFESLVSGLNALQIRLSAASSTKTKALPEQDKYSQQFKPSNPQALLQQIQQQQQNQQLQQQQPQQSGWRAILQNFGINQQQQQTARVEQQNSNRPQRSFLEAMRKALRPRRNEDGSRDNSKTRSKSAREIFGGKKERKGGVQAIASGKTEEYKEKIENSVIQVMASQAIDAVKTEEKLDKATNESEKPKDDKNKNSELQARIQRSRNRMQRLRDEAQQKAATEKRIDDMTAEKAVKQLQSLGVSLGESDSSKLDNKDLAALAKPNDKQRGG